MEEENPVDGRDPISQFVELTRDGFDEDNSDHLSALARLAAAASAAGCDDMSAIIMKALLKSGGQEIPYKDIRRQFSHGRDPGRLK